VLGNLNSKAVVVRPDARWAASRFLDLYYVIVIYRKNTNTIMAEADLAIDTASDARGHGNV